MLVKPKYKTETQFKHLLVGSCYRLASGETIFMKILSETTDGSFNAVSLIKAYKFYHSQSTPVTLVHGSFVEES